MKSKWKNLLILLAVVALAVVPLLMIPGKDKDGELTYEFKEMSAACMAVMRFKGLGRVSCNGPEWWGFRGRKGGPVEFGELLADHKEAVIFLGGLLAIAGVSTGVYLYMKRRK